MPNVNISRSAYGQIPGEVTGQLQQVAQLETKATPEQESTLTAATYTATETQWGMRRNLGPS